MSRERSVPAPGPGGAEGVVRNALFLFLAYVLPRVLTFGAAVVAARVLGTRDFGAYSAAAAFAVVLSVIATVGMMPLLIRDLARAPQNAPVLLAAAHRVKTGTNLLMLLALTGLGWGVLGLAPDVLSAAILLGLAYGVGAYVENLGAYFQAVERMDVWMQASALSGIVWGGLGVVLVATTSSLVWFCSAPVAGQAAALVFLLARLPRELRQRVEADGAEVRRLVRALLPYATASAALALYYKTDMLLLAHWRAETEVGVYAAAYKFIDILQALVLVAVGAAYPRLSRVAPGAAGSGRWAGTRLTELLLLGAVPVGALLCLMRLPLVRTLYGAAYAPSADVLAPLSLLVPALAINLLSGYLLSSTGRMHRVAAMYGAGLGLNVGLNALLIPALGAVGAALAMAASEVALAGGFLVLLRGHAAAPGPVAVAAAGGAFALWGAAALLAGPDTGALAAALYLPAVLLLYERTGALDEGERAALRRAVRGLRGVFTSSGAPVR